MNFFFQLKKPQDEFYYANSPIDKMTEAEIQNLIRNKFLVSPSSLPYNLTTNKTEQMYGKGLTWRFIDETLKTLFPYQRDGFFVEAGALNGEVLSNTLRLEQEQNWTGLLIEPVPHNFEELVQKRRKSWVSQACLSDIKHPKIVKMVEVRSNNFHVIPDIYARGSSYQIGNEDNDIPIHIDIQKNYFKSVCFPLYSFLLALNVTTVDFMSLDIQGPELEVINTIPFNKVYIRSMVIENIQDGLNSIDKSLVKTIEEKGFKFLRTMTSDNSVSVDYFFVNINDKELMERRIKFYIDRKIKHNQLGERILESRAL